MFVKCYWENTGSCALPAMQMDLVQHTQCPKLLHVCAGHKAFCHGGLH